MRKIYQDKVGNIATNPDNLTGNIWCIEETNGVFSEKNKKPYHGYFSDGYYKEGKKVVEDDRIIRIYDPLFNEFISLNNLRSYFLIMEISHGREEAIEWFNNLIKITI